MKKPNAAHNYSKINKLPFRSETVRILTQRELTLVVAGNCVEGSLVSQTSSTAVSAC